MFRFVYDDLRRPLEQWGNGRELSRAIYGEGATNVKTLNLRGQVITSYDGAGKHYVEEYDFKGVPRRSYMRLLANAQTADADWNVVGDSDLVTGETFFNEVVSDALSRPRSQDSGRILSAGLPATRRSCRIQRIRYAKNGDPFRDRRSCML